MEYRFAKLRLSQCQATSDRKARASFGADALGHAATAWLRFAGMDNGIGAIRARCLIAEILVELGRAREAMPHCEAAKDDVAFLADQKLAPEVIKPLLARLYRARGLAEAQLKNHINAKSLLQRATEAFDALGDWWSAAECRLHLGIVLHTLAEWDGANANLWSARSAFAEYGDNLRTAKVDEALVRTTLHHGGRYEARRRRKSAQRLMKRVSAAEKNVSTAEGSGTRRDRVRRWRRRATFWTRRSSS